jgi:putative DNA primase/helicase
MQNALKSLESDSAVETSDDVLVAANDNGATFELSEDGVARSFATYYGGSLRFDHSTGAWFEWTGSYWRKNEVGLAPHYVRLLARDMSAGNKKANSVRKKSFAAGVETFARNDPTFAVTIEAWDKDPFLLGTPDGTVDLRTGKMRPADPADGITKLTSVAPAAKADCPLWLKFLDESTGGDVELIRLLQQLCGYSLTGDTREHALFFIYGGGGNGKSVFLNTVSHIMFDYATMAASLASARSIGQLRNSSHLLTPRA